MLRALCWPRIAPTHLAVLPALSDLRRVLPSSGSKSWCRGNRPWTSINVLVVTTMAAFVGSAWSAERQAGDVSDSTAAPTSAWKDLSENLDSQWNDADQLRKNEAYGLAAQRYQQIMAQLPRSTQSQKAGLYAGECLVAAGRAQDAIPLFDQVISLGHSFTAPDYYNPTGKERKLPQLGKRLQSIREWTQEALYHKAKAHKQIGDDATAIRTIDQLRLEFPNSDYLEELIPLKGSLLRYSATQLEQKIEEERQASDALVICLRTQEEKQEDQALVGLRAIIDQYPESTAALRARADMAKILWGRSDYSQAKALYAGILSRGQEIAPNAHLVRLADAKTAWVDLQPKMRSIIGGHFSGQPAPTGDAEDAYRLCRIIMSKEDEAPLRCQANKLLIEMAVFRHDNQTVVNEARIFFRNYAGDKKKNMYSTEVCWVHIYAAQAYRERGEADKALAHTRAVTNLWKADPANWQERDFVPAALYEEVMTLRSAHAAEKTIDEVIQTLYLHFPESNYSRMLRLDR